MNNAARVAVALDKTEQLRKLGNRLSSLSYPPCVVVGVDDAMGTIERAMIPRPAGGTFHSISQAKFSIGYSALRGVGGVGFGSHVSDVTAFFMAIMLRRSTHDVVPERATLDLDEGRSERRVNPEIDKMAILGAIGCLLYYMEDSYKNDVRPSSLRASTKHVKTKNATAIRWLAAMSSHIIILDFQCNATALTHKCPMPLSP